MLDFTTTAHGWDVPGGPYYTDVTEFIEAATNQLAPGELLMMDNFTLAESMSAIEIMDPRLDSGLAQSLDEKPTASFDPYFPLLPEEVCWILDRAFATEGCALSQTVHTLLYVHELPTLDPLAWYRRQPKALPIDRPGNLVTSVLNASILGLLKSCDLVWREFAQKHVYENEDVMTEKSEISLCEGTSVARVVDSLESAEEWLVSQGGLPWSEELLLRVQLRKVMLRIFASRPRADSELNRQFLSMSRELVQRIKDRKQPSLPPLGSQARAAFDPAICRKFISHVPLPVIRLFDQERTWDALEAMFQGLQDLSPLEKTEDLRVWKTTLNLASRNPPSFKRCSYVRSRTTSSFTSTNALIFNTYPVSWLVREILSQVGGIPKGVIESLYSGADRVTLFHWHAFENPAAEVRRSFLATAVSN
ncbi:hypothetical protein BS47DRAFT_1197815 [Hydnum rufescens UP504]|uniref:NAA35-like N-terminal domain-containing protein n=1 Tax=Hydnum rufescens UP504 TaxID=1448309 RepID=A0A9P6DU15_9AGAM|nr:hypothetical protein BS47DRAFT_1197815 [Hydnum rufescens UP504]